MKKHSHSLTALKIPNTFPTANRNVNISPAIRKVLGHCTFVSICHWFHVQCFCCCYFYHYFIIIYHAFYSNWAYARTSFAFWSLRLLLLLGTTDVEINIYTLPRIRHSLSWGFDADLYMFNVFNSTELPWFLCLEGRTWMRLNETDWTKTKG